MSKEQGPLMWGVAGLPTSIARGGEWEPDVGIQTGAFSNPGPFSGLSSQNEGFKGFDVNGLLTPKD